MLIVPQFLKYYVSSWVYSRLISTTWHNKTLLPFIYLLDVFLKSKWSINIWNDWDRSTQVNEVHENWLFVNQIWRFHWLKSSGCNEKICVSEKEMEIYQYLIMRESSRLLFSSYIVSWSRFRKLNNNSTKRLENS